MLIRKILIFQVLFIAAIFTLDTCDSPGPGYFKFFSKTAARLKPEFPVKISGRCFESLKFKILKNKNSISVKISAKTKKEKTCVEFMLISTGKTTKYKFLFLSGNHFIDFPISELSENELKFIENEGLFILRSCDEFKNTLKNIIMTAKLFIGGWGQSPLMPIFGTHIPKFQKKANIDFIEKNSGYKWQTRKNHKYVKIAKKAIKSGDLLFVNRFDGMDSLVEVCGGSKHGHVAMAFWEKGELWIIESKNSGILKQGIYRLSFERWMYENKIQDSDVVLMPLKNSIRQKLNLEKMWSAFLKLEGNSYGFRNYMFSLIDTPDKNMPELFDLVFFSAVLKTLEPILLKQLTAVFYEGWNARLGTKGLDMAGIWEELYARNVSLGELSAIPEKDGFEYSNGINYVCSTFVAHLFKEGGLFQGFEINATEFTPRDIADLNFFEIGKDGVPENCGHASPRGYCQIMGKMDFDLGKIGYVEPYSHMDEKCATFPAGIERVNGC